jgi:mersacidin/lichenicidin family type 2 lantibiotic
MQDIDKIVRAWKDEDYRLSLSADEQKALPANPAGSVELLQADLQADLNAAAYLSLLRILAICIG